MTTKTIIRLIEQEVIVYVCDLCHKEDETKVNRLVLAWSKYGVGTNSDGYDLCEDCYSRFVDSREQWIKSCAPPPQVNFIKEDEQIEDAFVPYNVMMPSPKRYPRAGNHNVDERTWK